MAIVNSARIAAAGLLFTAFAAAGCAGGGGAPVSSPRNLYAARMPAATATVASDASAGAAAVGRRAARVAAQAPAEGATRRIEPAAAPFLYGAPLGRRFLKATGARALAIGEPSAFCPAGAVATAPDASLASVGAEALRRCLAPMRASGRTAPDGTPCGCRLIALGDALLAEPEAYAYAPGVGARLLGLGDARPLVAHEAAGPSDGDIAVLFESAAGPVAEARLLGDGRARLIHLGSGVVYEGTRVQVGWGRGRLRERLDLTGPDGRRVVALIGYEPEDLFGAP